MSAHVASAAHPPNYPLDSDQQGTHWMQSGTLRIPNGTLTRPVKKRLPSVDEQMRMTLAPVAPGPCVHELCTCKQHKCTCGHLRSAPFYGNTTYKDDYIKKEAPPLQPRLRDRPPTEPLPFNAVTTHKTDYVPWDLPQKGAIPPAPVERHSLPFDGTTTYTTDYLERPLPQQGPKGPRHEWQPNSAPFYGETTHNLAYTPKPLEKQHPFREAPRPGPSLPFAGDTTYGTDYVKKHVQPAVPFHKGGEAQRHPDNRDFKTETQGNYVQHPLEPHRPTAAPQRAMPQLPFDGATSYNTDFDAKPLPSRRERPAPAPTASLPFVGTTTHQVDYQKWNMPPAVARGPPAVVRPSLPFDGTTTYTTDYFEKEAQPPMRGVRQEWKPNEAPFYGETTHNVDYTAKPIDRAAPRKDAPRSGPVLPFDGQTTYGIDYVKKEAPINPSAGPQRSVVCAPDTRDFNTTYGGDYQPKELPVQGQKCPLYHMPPYPEAQHPREHVFWDPAAEKWY